MNNNKTDNNEIFEFYLKEYYNDNLLINHRTYIERNSLGFGEKCFHPMWRELIKLQPDNFKFLEIGVYKGQILSLVKLLSDTYVKNVEYYGVTPLDNTGDKFSKYHSEDYKQIIISLFKYFNLDFDPNINLIIGESTIDSIKTKIKNLGSFDLIYIDGCHDYDCVVSDIMLMKEISKIGTYVVLDDASCFMGLSNEKFKGHIDVCEAVKDTLESDSSFLEIVCVGHNRVFKKIK